MNNKIKNFIIDSDGVLTDGSFYYTVEGKMMKKFGPDDNDALGLIKNLLNIHVISGDKRGFEVTKKRVAKDMGLKLSLVSTFERIEWIRKNYDPKKTVYMGDGIFDSLVFGKVAYGIAPANAFDLTKKKANFITKRRGGDGAVAEASMHIIKKFIDPEFNLLKFNFDKGTIAWKKK